ncbi:hypothetical protein GGF43_001258 [Coemansia sp. RSA 2618]|nr:hypothetical protein GGF43_001258 [Coemansia sp. RSA 2618]
MSSVAQPSHIQFVVPCPDAKFSTSPAPLKRSSSSLAIRQQRRLSMLRLMPAKSPGGSPRLSSNKKPRVALQSIHIRALEHGLRVPVCNTPLGVVGLDENIAYTPTQSDLPRTALPTTASFPRLDLLAQLDSAPPQSPTRRNQRARRNSMG